MLPDSIIIPTAASVATKIASILINAIRPVKSISINSMIIIDEKASRECIEDHLGNIRYWSSSIHLHGMTSEKDLSDIYIELALNEDPSKERMGKTRKGKLRREDILSTHKHAIILGELGSGKTTLLQKLAYDIMDFSKSNKSHNIPFVFRLRDFTVSDSLTAKLSILLGLNIQAKFNDSDSELILLKAFNDDLSKLVNHIRMLSIVELLNKLKVLLLLDGIDEMPYSIRNRLLSELDFYGARIYIGKVIASCRSADFTRIPDGFKVYEIEKMSSDQIKRFGLLWFSSQREQKLSTEQFFQEMKSKPYKDLGSRPLTLANLCMVFERYGQLPEMAVTIYRKMLNLLLEEWDAQRGVTRGTKYAGFDAPRKVDFLAAFAFRLATKYKNRLTFSTSILQEVYREIAQRFKLPLEEAVSVATEIQSHTGIIIRTGYDEYEFSHKSLQEFLVAEYLTRLRDLPQTLNLLRDCPNELAISVALSSDPNDYFLSLFRNKGIRIHPKREFLLPFLSRVVLENPGFEESSELGATFLWLISKFYETTELSNTKKGTINMNTTMSDRLLNRILKLNNIKESIKKYAKNCSLITSSENENELTIRSRDYIRSKYPVVEGIHFDTLPKAINKLLKSKK